MSAPRLVLVGLPGSGKSTVGPLLAARLGWSFVDLDDEIVRRADQSIAEIFATAEESGFRRREAEATAALAHRGPMVVAPGGGWMLDPANAVALGGVSQMVYLKVSPEVAASRIGGAAAERPLLAGPNLAARIGELLRQREETYLQAKYTVSVDVLAPDDIASLIVALAST